MSIAVVVTPRKTQKNSGTHDQASEKDPHLSDGRDLLQARFLSADSLTKWPLIQCLSNVYPMFFRLSNFGAALGSSFCWVYVRMELTSLFGRWIASRLKKVMKLMKTHWWTFLFMVLWGFEATGRYRYSPIIKRCLLGEPSSAAQSATLHQDVKCRGCGEVVKSDSNYCRHCGVPIKAREVGADMGGSMG